MAKRYYCPLNAWHRCERGDGKPKHPKCRGCGATLQIENGSHGVFHWASANRYPAEDAVKVYQSPTAAQNYVDKNGGDLVVRWIYEGDAK